MQILSSGTTWKYPAKTNDGKHPFDDFQCWSFSPRDLANPLELGQVGCTVKAQFIYQNFGLQKEIWKNEIKKCKAFLGLAARCPSQNFDVGKNIILQTFDDFP